jgi:membrane protein YdbS with pleckstrin-like domain
MIGHVLASILLGIVSGCITYAIGYENPWPYVVGVIVFLAYWGVSILIIDADWDW